MGSDPKPTERKLEAALVERRRTIESELAEIEATAKETTAGGIGFGKRIGEGTNVAVERISEVAIHGSLLGELATVGRAEEKLAEGSSGICDGCGGPIPAERLEVVPWAVRCVNCAV